MHGSEVSHLCCNYTGVFVTKSCTASGSLLILHIMTSFVFMHVQKLIDQLNENEFCDGKAQYKYQPPVPVNLSDPVSVL